MNYSRNRSKKLTDKPYQEPNETFYLILISGACLHRCMSNAHALFSNAVYIYLMRASSFRY